MSYLKNFVNDLGKIFLENTLEYAVDKFKEAYPRLKEIIGGVILSGIFSITSSSNFSITSSSK